MKIEEINKDKRLDQFLEKHWGSNFIVSKGKRSYGHDLNAFAILEGETIIGLLTYYIKDSECELVSIDALKKNQGIGTKLIKKLIEKTKSEKGLKRIWLITTNDDIDAIKFYQKRGFVFKAVYPDSIKESRKLKPEIPKVGNYGIPIRDEIEMEYVL